MTTLHKLAMLHVFEVGLTQKLAMISPAKDTAIAQQLHKKMMDMAVARGVEIPMTEGRPDLESMRMSTPKGQVTSPLAEKEIQKAHGVVSNSPLKQLKRRGVQRTKSFLAGKGGLGGKLRNRGTALGALALLGGLGAGVKSYLDSDKNPQDSLQTSPEELQSMYSQQQGAPQYPGYYGYPKAAASGFDDIGKAPSSPKGPTVSAPGPSVANIKLDTGILSGPNFAAPKASGSKSLSTATPSASKTAEESTAPLLAGLAGGVGGFMAGDKLIRPALKGKEKAILEAIARQQKRVTQLQNFQKLAPIGAATAGALLLAAVAAALGKRKGREEAAGANGSENPNMAGFQANNQVDYGDLREMYE